MPVKLSLIIPAKNVDDPKLKELLQSIENQDFPKDEMETLVITEGTSESAKAIGIRRAKGDVVGILASDNILVQKKSLKYLHEHAESYGAAYPMKYEFWNKDNILNRYFALFGCNDPLAFYMKKCDRAPHVPIGKWNSEGTIGDNGYFIQKSLIEKTDLENYYHVDNAIEAQPDLTCVLPLTIWHRTGGNIFKFFTKRYRYGLQHAFNKNRRWHLVDFKKPKDIRRFLCFIFYTVTIIQPLSLSLRGYLKIRDLAWFLHWPVCVMTLLTYGLLSTNLLAKKLFQSLFAPMAVRRA